MNHDHDHSHSHSHDHDHSHSHSHDQAHDHTHDHPHPRDSKPDMSTKEKLDVLLAHWVDHNDSHKDNYYSWAKKAEQAGLDTIAAHLKQAGDLSEKVTQQLKQAGENLHG